MTKFTSLYWRLDLSFHSCLSVIGWRDKHRENKSKVVFLGDSRAKLLPRGNWQKTRTLITVRPFKEQCWEMQEGAVALNRTQKMQKPQLMVLIPTAEMLGRSGLFKITTKSMPLQIEVKVKSMQATVVELWFHIVKYSSGKGKVYVVLISCNYTPESDIPEQNVEVTRVSLAHLILPFQNSSTHFPRRLQSLCFPWIEARSTDVSLHRPSRNTIWQIKIWTLNQDSWVQILPLPPNELCAFKEVIRSLCLSILILKWGL